MKVLILSQKNWTLFLYNSVPDSCHIRDGNTSNIENILVTCILYLFSTSRKFIRPSHAHKLISLNSWNEIIFFSSLNVVLTYLGVLKLIPKFTVCCYESAWNSPRFIFCTVNLNSAEHSTFHTPRKRYVVAINLPLSCW